MSQSTPAPTKPILTIEEAAAETIRSHWTLRRAISRRELATFRPGGARGKIYIRREDLNAYINRFRTAALGERALATTGN